MTHDAFDELAHATLDGTATPEQRTTLDAQLGSDPAARERWLDLETTYSALGHMRAVEPPLDLKPAIMRAIHAERRAAHGSSESVGVRARLGRALALPLASAFAMGAVAGVMVWPLVAGDHSGFNNLPASGTMMPGPGAATIDRLSLAAGTATLVIELVTVPGGVGARIEGRAGGNAEIVLEHDGTLAVESLREIEAQPLRAAFAPGRIGIEFAGEMRCSILLKGSHAATRRVRVALRAGGMTSTGELGRGSQ